MDVIIYTAFSTFIILNLYFFMNKILKTAFDKIMGFVGLLTSVIIIYSVYISYKSYLDIGHYLYCGFYIPLIAFFSRNDYVLLLNILMITCIILSRYYYKCCVLSKKQDDNGYFVELSHKLKLNWNFLFPFLLLISFINYLYK